MHKKIALGIDIGGTNTAFGLVDKNGEILFESNLSTRSFETPELLVSKIYEIISSQQNIDEIKGIAIGAPNGNHFTGEIVNAPNLTWKGVIPLAKLFEEKFKIPSQLTNDANAAAIGEHLFGNAKDLKDFVSITLGTGLGSGVFIDGKIVYGNQGYAGEFGHIKVIPEGRLCGCGRKGCLETYASSTGVVRSVEELDSENKTKSSLLQLEEIDAKTIFSEAQNGDVFAMEIVDYTAQILGISLADFACFSNPKAYVLFGGIAQSGNFFADKVKIAMEENLLNILKNNIEIRVSGLHNVNAAILGGAATVFSMD
jgi:glucokinase